MSSLSRAAAVLDEHSVMEIGIASWRCGCGYEGTDFPPGHIAQALADAGLLKEEAAGDVTVEEAPVGHSGMEAVLAWFRNGGC